MVTQQQTRKPEINWINDSNAAKIIPLNGSTTAASYPHDLHAERMVLAIILGAGALGRGNNNFSRLHFLKHTDFYKQAHGLIYRAMERIVQDNKQIDVVSVLSELAGVNHGGKTMLELAGGQQYIAGLAAEPGSNIETHAQNVLACAIARANMKEANDLILLSQNVKKYTLREYSEQLAQAHKGTALRLNAFTQADDTNGADALNNALAKALAERNNPNLELGITSGLANFDKACTGFIKRKGYFFSAPSGWGKTALLLNFLAAAVRDGQRVLFITLEMFIDELMERLICILAEVDYTVFQCRTWTSEEWGRIERAINMVASQKAAKNCTLVCLNQPTLKEIESKLIQYQDIPGYDVVFIDYLGMGTVSFPEVRSGDENTMAMQMYNEFERWKKTYNAAFVSGLQMTREGIKRVTQGTRKLKLPDMGDLYYGNRAAQVADFIGFIYHENRVRKSSKKPAQILIRKLRYGASENIALELNWQPQYQIFSSKVATAMREINDIMPDEEDEEITDAAAQFPALSSDNEIPKL